METALASSDAERFLSLFICSPSASRRATPATGQYYVGQIMYFTMRESSTNERTNERCSVFGRVASVHWNCADSVTDCMGNAPPPAPKCNIRQQGDYIHVLAGRPQKSQLLYHVRTVPYRLRMSSRVYNRSAKSHSYRPDRALGHVISQSSYSRLGFLPCFIAMLGNDLPIRCDYVKQLTMC